MDDAAQRAARRRQWPIHRYRLGDEPSDDISARTTAAERLAMVWPLTLQAWQLAGHDIPDYTRENTPGRVIRPGSSGHDAARP